MPLLIVFLTFLSGSGHLVLQSYLHKQEAIVERLAKLDLQVARLEQRTDQWWPALQQLVHEGHRQSERLAAVEERLKIPPSPR